MATPTLANSPDPHQLFPETARPFAPAIYPKPQSEFRVFPTSNAEYHWRIVALASNRTISRHKSLTLALKKCNRLNDQRETQLDPLKVAPFGFPDVNTYRAYYEGVGYDYE